MRDKPLNFRAPPEELQIGAWRVEPRAGRLRKDGAERTLEPKVMDLLLLLASRPASVVSHEEILAGLWPNMVVGDDTLARCVSKLRKGLGDDPKRPTYVETISKRGYRLIAAVGGATSPSKPPPRRGKRRLLVAGAFIAFAILVGVVLVAQRTPSAPDAALLARAQDAYFQYTRSENETAIALYERILANEPDNATASAGLARALVQRVLRWPNRPGEFTRTTLGEALAEGRTDTPQARRLLDRAHTLARGAADRAPNNATVLQALGLTLAARRDFRRRGSHVPARAR